MSQFDALIAEIGPRFGLGPKTEALLQELVRLIEDHPGGLGGFLSQIKSAGFGDQVASWLGGGAGLALSGPEAEEALGGGVVAAIAGRLGLGTGTVGDVIGAILPKLVALLTPGGVIPKVLPASMTTLLNNPPPRLPKELGTPSTATGSAPARKSAAVWTIPLAILAGIGLLVYVVPRLHKEPAPVAEAPKAVATAPAAVPAPAPPAPALTPAPAPSAPARLRLERANGVLAYGGSVGSADNREAIVALLKSRFGAEHIKGDVEVDPNVAPPGWLASLKPALDLFKSQGWRAVFDGSSLDIGAPAADRDKILAGLKSIYGSALTISASHGAPATAAKTRADEDQTAAALAGLKSGFSGADLVAILNKYVINFDTGSATISDASKPILRQAAGLIRTLPKGATVHIDGYTDASGDAAANVALSRRRAEAVRALLIEAGVKPAELKARGHGVAAAAEGDSRAERRIEFSIR
jgi:outer membrane protein OmpA-like peptidoglycan-associated protein/uncharacterized protein YidB (DUF937 family)